jgi:hypothetical protein
LFASSTLITGHVMQITNFKSDDEKYTFLATLRNPDNFVSQNINRIGKRLRTYDFGDF